MSTVTNTKPISSKSFRDELKLAAKKMSMDRDIAAKADKIRLAEEKKNNAAAAKANKIRLAEEKKNNAAAAKANKIRLAEEKTATTDTVVVGIDTTISPLPTQIRGSVDSDDDSVSDVLDTTSLSNSNKHTGKNTKLKLVVPWSGVMDMTMCHSLRLNYGLYTQCTNDCNGDIVYCRQCTKKELYNIHGTVEMRTAVGSNDYVAPNGKPVCSYGDYLLKAKIDKVDAEDRLNDMGIKLSKEDYALSVKKRATKSKSDNKIAKGDDIIADLVATAAAKLNDIVIEEGRDCDTDDFIDVETWVCAGTEYLLDRDTNKVYDRNTNDEIGLRRGDDSLLLV